MLYREGGLSTALRETGILCVPMTGVKKKQMLSVNLWALIQVLVSYTLVINNTLCKTNTQSVSVASNFGRGTNPILPKSIQCSTDDPTFSDCNTTDLNVSQCQHVAGVICEGVYYSYHPHCVLTVLSAYFSALCLTVGHTDCEKCGSHRHCNIDYICNCYSDCYAYGSCCPDVSYVENCVG